MFKRLMTMAALALSMGAVACTAEVEEEGKMPDVDVRAARCPRWTWTPPTWK